jgi:protein-L-isoaspartate(D-aspartate) O-methyltransferase
MNSWFSNDPSGDRQHVYVGSEEAAATTSTVSLLRTAMVQSLYTGGALQDQAVGQAMSKVPRHLFLPGVPVPQAYADIAIPTHWRDHVAVSSASQPAIVAIMLEQLQVGPGDQVLEIGAGTGYNAALLAELVGPSGNVTTVDIDGEIVAEALDHLATAGYPQVRVVVADGASGWVAGAPYDRIILTVGASDIAPAWYEQLREDGILVLPLWLGGVELSVAFRKRAGSLYSLSQTPCGFMRLRGEESSTEQWVALPRGRKLFASQAAELVEPVSRLLNSRPRVRLWGRPKPSFFQYLGLHGHHLVAIYTDRRRGRNPAGGRHIAGRWGIYAEDGDGPSLALFALWTPVLLVFGGSAAEHILTTEFALWQSKESQPVEQWRISAHPRELEGAGPFEVEAGGVDVRVARRHFVFTIDMGGPDATHHITTS